MAETRDVLEVRLAAALERQHQAEVGALRARNALEDANKRERKLREVLFDLVCEIEMGEGKDEGEVDAALSAARALLGLRDE
jgi:hypothetical protein